MTTSSKSCSSSSLISAIENVCGYNEEIKANAVIISSESIKDKKFTEENTMVEIVLKKDSPQLSVYCPSDSAYKPISSGTKNSYGVTKYQKSIEIMLLDNSPLTQEQVLQLNEGSNILIIYKDDAANTGIVFGAECGLRFSASSDDLGSKDTHGGIVVTMAERDCSSSMVFLKQLTVSEV